MTNRFLLILVFAVVTAQAVNAQAGASDAAVAQIMVEYERLDRIVDPITAGQEGDLEALARLPDASLAGQRRLETEFAALGRKLAQIDAQQLSAEPRLNHSLLTRQVAMRVEGYGYDLSRIAFENDSGFHTLADYLARTTTLSSRAEADAWMSRLKALPEYYRQNVANLRRGVETKQTQPRIVVERVLDVARQQVAAKPEDSALLLPFAKMPAGIPQSVQDDYRARALKVVRDEVVPEQKAFAQFLESSYLPAARPAIAWRSTPNGEATYRFLVRRETTTDMTPDQIHQLGQSEVARIRGLMEKTIASTGFKGTFAEFLHMLRTDPKFYPKSAQELLEKASEIAKRADGKLPPLFGRLPQLTYDVRPVPAEMAEGYTTGRYWGGSMKLGQPGGYIVNTSRLNQRPLYELPALTVHEAVPGHHLQIALSQELDDLPYFRRNLSPTAFVEGWGLYSEFLGEEMGIYRDAYEMFGRYSYEMWRACRLVADTGIHWLGWDIEQARRCFTENSALSPHNIQTELERYISWPGQALAYKIGELKLRGLRREAEGALGEKFNVRKFHDVVLLRGALPLDVLEVQVREWIKVQQRS